VPSALRVGPGPRARDGGLDPSNQTRRHGYPCHRGSARAWSARVAVDT